MTTVLILAAGDPGFDADDGGYPLCLTEVDGVPMIERIVAGCRPLSPQRYVFALRERDATRFHLDNVVRLLAPDAAVVRASATRGAACTVLLAAEYADVDSDLLILNTNELVDVDLAAVIRGFGERSLDAGVVTFRSVHPRYSYVSVDAQGLVTEAAEKNPISQHATAGIYWYAKGSDLIAAIKAMIRRDAQLEGNFYVCPAFNEMILARKSIGIHPIATEQYRPLKSIRQLHHLESTLEGKHAG